MSDKISIRKRCETLGIRYNTVIAYRRKHPELDIDYIIEYYRLKKNHIPLKTRCRGLNISYSKVYDYMRNNPGISADDAIDIYLKPKEKAFKHKYIELNIKPTTAYNYRKAHPDLSDNDILNYYKNKEKTAITTKQKCKDAGVSYLALSGFKRRHEGLTDDEIICKYNTNCFINILGELVIPK